MSSLTRTGALLGTPLYMAPEAWRGEPLGARADLYSLGALVFTLCTGRPPYAGATLEALRAAVLGQDAQGGTEPSGATGFPGLRGGPQPVEASEVHDRRSSAASEPTSGGEPQGVRLQPLLPPEAAGFAAIVERCLLRSEKDRFASADALSHVLAQLDAAAGQTLPDGNPYRGLTAFDEGHRSLFFGRGSQVASAIELLRSQAMVVVAGDSGVGKSSLCQAGILPRVEDGALGEQRRWSVLKLVPGRRPLRILAEALAARLGEDEAQVEALLRSSPWELARRVRAKLGDGEGLLVFVDQAGRARHPVRGGGAGARGAGARRAALAGWRVASARHGARRLPHAPVGTGGTGRSTGSRALPPSPPRTGGAARGHHRPAHASGVRFESERTVEALVAFAARAPGGLPLLQFALAELWERRDAARGLIPEGALAGIGGAEGALARHAEAVYGRLLPPQRQAARGLLIRLATGERTRARRTGRRSSSETNPTKQSTLAALVQGRLLSSRQTDGDGDVYEVAHEALLTGWDRLRGWLTGDAEVEAARRRLEDATAEWERLDHASDALWTAPQLAGLHALAASGAAPGDGSPPSSGPHDARSGVGG